MTILLAILAATASPGAMPDLDNAIRNYATLAQQADASGDNAWMVEATTNVCRVALRYSLETRDPAAVDPVVNYRGPRAKQLLLSCSIYFQAHSR